MNVDVLKDIVFRELLEVNLRQLDRVVQDLLEPTVPQTPLPPPRQFLLLCDEHWEITWPGTPPAADYGVTNWHWAVVRHEGRVKARYIADPPLVRDILNATGCQPRAILRVVRRIQAAIAWTAARRAGRERMAQEILRQQRAAVETLEAEYILQRLAKGDKRR